MIDSIVESITYFLVFFICASVYIYISVCKYTRDITAYFANGQW